MNKYNYNYNVMGNPGDYAPPEVGDPPSTDSDD